ncbi:hypothetical protein [Streptomyces sp. NBC_00829]|uniref:hypothetical protein n=1 Tax=Streptomyces sp. NBC_00829 TaxID=2903679 RepID=UPI00386D8692|nr:hypothetical protein OG293_06775 [Streptomyces sp. NBC_00829]
MPRTPDLPSRSAPRARWSERGARAGVFAVTSAGLAGAGHHVASGEPAVWRLLVAAATVAFLGALPWAHRRRSLVTVATATCTAQLLLHEVLAQAGPDRHGVPHGTGHPMPGDHGVHPSAAVMLLAHTLAALAVAVLLHRTDDQLAALPFLVGQLADTLRTTAERWLGRLRTDQGRGRGSGRRSAGAGPRPLPGVPACAALAHVVVRRGPPGHGPLPSRP